MGHYFDAIEHRDGSKLVEMIGPPTDEEYEVYTAVCRTKPFRLMNEGALILNQTEPPQNPLTKPLSRPGFFDDAQPIFQNHPEILTDFRAKNAQPWPLEARFKTPGGMYHLLPLEQLHAQFRDPAIIVFSRVGFSADESFAYVVRENPVIGYHIVLAKKDDRWDVVTHELSWCE